MKQLQLKNREWERIFARIKEDYASTPSVYLIREKMKDTLGFTVRHHAVWTDDYNPDATEDWRDSHTQIHIDFYDETARTMFMLRYL